MTYHLSSSKMFHRGKTMELELTKDSTLKDLFEAIALIEDREECGRFLRDLCTFNELKGLAERWEVAKLVDQGLSYREISRRTGASTTTVTRVAHWVKHGEGGYQAMLRRVNDRASSSNHDTGSERK